MLEVAAAKGQPEGRTDYYAVESSLGRPCREYGRADDLATALKIARAVIDLGLEKAPIIYRAGGNGRRMAR